RMAVAIHYAALGVDAQAAEGEGDAAGDGIGLERRLVDGVGPVRLVDGKALGATAVLDVRIELDVGAHRLVVGLDGRQRLRRVDVLELVAQLFQRVGAHLAHALDAVFVAQHRDDLVVEHLVGELLRLLEHHAAVFGIGVVAEVGALVDEALAIGIDHDAPGIRVLLEIVADRQVAVLRRVAIPLHRVAAGPVADRLRADGERHLDAVAGVEAGAADLCQLPGGPEIARAHLRVGLEAPGREHDAFGGDLHGAALMTHANAFDAVIVGDQRKAARVVGDGDVVFLRRFGEHLDETRATAPGLDGESAPELELAVDLVGLASPDRREADALVPQPAHGVAAARDQDLAEIGVGAVFGDPSHVVEELVLRVSAEIRLRDLLVREVGHQRAQILDAIIDAAESAGGEAAVAAGFILRGALDDQHRHIMLGGGECRAERRITGTDHDYIN